MNYPNYNPYVNQYVPSNNFGMQQPGPINKIVDSLESVRSADIPMDGSAYYFPKADGSMIYSKKWLPNCTTQIMAYMPCENVQPTNNPIDNTKGQEQANLLDSNLSQRIISIEEKIENIEKLLSPKSSAKKVTKDESQSIN